MVDKTSSFIPARFKAGFQSLVQKTLSNDKSLKAIHIFCMAFPLLYLAQSVFNTSTFVISTWLFLKLVGVTFLIAFLSIRPQLIGLVGENGITPAKDTMKEMEKHLVKGELPHWARILRFPTLCWISTTDRFLRGMVYTGLACSLFLIAGIGPMPILLTTLYTCYLSIYLVADDWLSLQWDILLLETGFLAIVLSLTSYGFQMTHFLPSQNADGSKIILFLIQWLCFRLLFFSGIVKLSSRDPNWVSLKAMNYHYWTQPIPTGFSRYMHNLPQSFHELETLGTFVIELVLPFMLFAPLQLRCIGAFGIVGLNMAISTTGNYGFFNFLTSILAVTVFEDNFYSGSIFTLGFASYRIPSLDWSILLTLPILIFVMGTSVNLINRAFRTQIFTTPKIIDRMDIYLRSFHIVNSYGLFAVMTTKRTELVLEGSNDGEHWMAYECKYKPGDVNRRPPFIPGHMPRLDWMLWFCPFRRFPNIPNWIVRLLDQIWKGSQDVLDLFESTPFPASDPPKFLRITLYEYKFTSNEEYKKMGKWWNREAKGRYIPFSLINPKFGPESSN